MIIGVMNRATYNETLGVFDLAAYRATPGDKVADFTRSVCDMILNLDKLVEVPVTTGTGKVAKLYLMCLKGKEESVLAQIKEIQESEDFDYGELTKYLKRRQPKFGTYIWWDAQNNWFATVSKKDLGKVLNSLVNRVKQAYPSGVYRIQASVNGEEMKPLSLLGSTQLYEQARTKYKLLEDKGIAKYDKFDGNTWTSVGVEESSELVKSAAF